jgi:hypothetical protein
MWDWRYSSANLNWALNGGYRKSPTENPKTTASVNYLITLSFRGGMKLISLGFYYSSRQSKFIIDMFSNN